MLDMSDHVCVSGFQISAASTGRDAGSLVALPPVARTVPSGRIVRLWNVRPYVIEPAWRNAGLGCDRSSTYAVLSEAAVGMRPGAPGLPDFMITPGRYITELPPATATVSTIVHVCAAMSSTRVWITASVELA